MWLVMIVPALGTLAIALGWSLRGESPAPLKDARDTELHYHGERII